MLFEKINAILFEKWDPLLVGENPKLSDEYDNTTNKLVKLLTSSITLDDIIKFLLDEEKLYASTVDEQTRLSVAQQLYELTQVSNFKVKS